MTRLPLIVFGTVAVGGAFLLATGATLPLPAWSVWVLVLGAGALAVHELLGRPVPFLRWSFLRMIVGMKTRAGDGREEDAARHVLAHAPRGDLDAAIRAIDDYAYRHKFLINVGDRKGAILDQAIERAKPKRVLELGAYVGYSALRIARMLPAGGHLHSIELDAANAEIARRIVEHAGVADRVTIVVGQLGDRDKTLAALKQHHGFGPGCLDFVFIDHAKEAYVPDLERILDAGFLHEGSVVVADNVGFPGAPEYRAYMEAAEGKRWRTRVHETRVEYQSVIADLMLESTLLGG